MLIIGTLQLTREGEFKYDCPLIRHYFVALCPRNIEDVPCYMKHYYRDISRSYCITCCATKLWTGTPAHRMDCSTSITKSATWSRTDFNNALNPRQYGRHFPDAIFKCIFLNENIQISNTISLKFVPKGPINNIPALVQIMAWRRPGDKPLSKPMIVYRRIYASIGLNDLLNRRAK